MIIIIITLTYLNCYRLVLVPLLVKFDVVTMECKEFHKSLDYHHPFLKFSLEEQTHNV